MFRFGELQDRQPAGDERAGAGCDDCPGDLEVLEGGEEGAGAGDFGCVAAVLQGDLAFECADVYLQGGSGLLGWCGNGEW